MEVNCRGADLSMTENTKQTDLIEFKFGEVFKRLDRIEGKVDGFTFVKQSDFDTFVRETKAEQEKFVRKESIKWIQYVVGGIAVGVGVAIVLGVIRVIGAKL